MVHATQQQLDRANKVHCPKMFVPVRVLGCMVIGTQQEHADKLSEDRQFEQARRVSTHHSRNAHHRNRQ